MWHAQREVGLNKLLIDFGMYIFLIERDFFDWKERLWKGRVVSNDRRDKGRISMFSAMKYLYAAS